MRNGEEANLAASISSLGLLVGSACDPWIEPLDAELVKWLDGRFPGADSMAVKGRKSRATKRGTPLE